MIQEERNNRIALNALFLYLRMFLAMGISFYTSRLLLQVLGVEDFGIVNIVYSLIILFTIFTSAFSNVLQRYLNIELEKENFQKANLIFCMVFWTCLIVSLIILGGTALLGEWLLVHKLTIPVSKLPSTQILFYCLVVAVFLQVNQIPWQSAVIAREHMSFFAFAGLGDAFMRLCIAVYLCHMEHADKLILYGWLFLFMTLVTTCLYVGYSLSALPETRLRLCWDKTLLKAMSPFFLFNLFGGIAWNIGYEGLNLLLNSFFGPAVTAARSISLQIYSAISRFCENFLFAMKPQLIKSYAAEEYRYVYNLLVTSSKLSFYLMLFLVIPIMAETHYVLALWLRIVPEYTVIFTRIVLLNALLLPLMNPLNLINNATGRNKNQEIYGRLITLSSLPVAYLFLKFDFSPVTPVVIWFLVQALTGLYWLYDVKRQLHFCWKNYIFSVWMPISICCCLISLPVSVITQFMPESFWRLLIVEITVLIFGGLIIYLIGLNHAEKCLLHKLTLNSITFLKNIK